MLTTFTKLAIHCVVMIIIWYVVVRVFKLPDYILPTPNQVAAVFATQLPLLLHHAWITLSETLAGLALGISFGIIAALLILSFNPMRNWFLPILIASQAIPTFAIAPVIVMWFGYGIASKLIITMIMIFFPVTSSLYDGLTRLNRDWITLAKSMHATKLRTLFYIYLPGSLPSLAQGLKIAAVTAPIGAIIGEWVGSSAGLGYLMLLANGRMQIDLMFAALLLLITLSLGLYFITHHLFSKLTAWQPRSSL